MKLKMINKLSDYYQQQGISPLDFRCPHLKVCKKGNKNFKEAKEAFVGTKYEKGVLPRLLFVSLDPGESNKDPEHRTVKYIRFQEEYKCDISKSPKNRHWYRTHELALILLKKIKSDMQLKDSHRYFAHTNSAKCSMGNDDHKSAPSIVFNNCRKYIGGEITILKPDILVTQGNRAKVAIEKSFEISTSRGNKSFCSYEQILIGGREVLWFHTYHPRCYGKFNRQRHTCFKKWAKIIYDEFHR